MKEDFFFEQGGVAKAACSETLYSHEFREKHTVKQREKES